MKWIKKLVFKGLIPQVALSLGLLTGCSAVSYDLQKTWEYALQKNQDVVLTKEQISEFPYTAMYGQVEGAPQILVVLGFIDKTGAVERLSWITGSRESVTTEYARIVSTSGLDVDLAGVSDVEKDPLRCVLELASPTHSKCSPQWIRQIDMVGGERSGTETIISSFSVIGQETLQLPAGAKDVIRVAEKGRFVFARQAFTNEFWLEADGHVVKSRQQLMPNTKSIEMTQVKWVGRND